MAKNRFIVDFLFGAKKDGSFDKTFTAVSQKVKSLTKTVAGVAATYVSARALGQVSQSALESASGLESYRSTLNVVMKDQKKAAETMAWAVDFANRTPFETDSVVEATVRLQSYGIEAQKVMTQIGDMAGVMNKDLMQAVEAVADAQTGELERMKEFGITKAMIEAKGAELYKNQTIINNKGQIVDQEKFNDALFALMEERFKGGMEIQAKSYKGLMSTITGVWKTGLANMAGISGTGEIIDGSAFDLAKDGLTWVADKMQAMASSGTFTKIGKQIGSTLQTGIRYGKQVLTVAKRIKEAVGDTLRSISARLEPLRPLMDRIIEKATALGRKLTDGFTRAGPKLQRLAETLIPAAASAIGHLASAALSFANFVVDHWNVIGPIVEGVVGSFLAFRALNGISNIIGKVKNLVDIFKTIRGITGFAGKIQGLAGAFKGFGGIAKFILSPFGKWALIIGAIIAACALLVKYKDQIRAFFDGIGNWILSKTKPAVDWLNNVVDTISQKLKQMGNGIASFFSGLWTGIVDGFKGFVNFFIKGINTIIGGINKLSFTAPDWVPGIGGETVGFNLPTIPLLAQGGVATRPTLAMVGEGREHEAILPLSKLKGLLGLSQTSLAATMESLTRRPAAAVAGGSSYHYSPQIIFQGGSRQEQDQVLADDKKRFERWLKEREEHDRRTRIKPKK